MQNFENRILGVSFTVDDDWEVISYMNKTPTKNWSDLYQSNENDLPTKNEESKFLFTANLLESDGINVRCGIEVSLFKYNTDFTKEFPHEKGAVIGSEKLNGFNFQTSTLSSEDHLIKFMWQQTNENYWLYIKASAYGPENIKELQNYLNQLVQIHA